MLFVLAPTSLPMKYLPSNLDFIITFIVTPPRWLRTQIFDADEEDEDPNATLHRGRILERNRANGDLSRHFRVNMDVTSNPRRALRRMYVWHLGGSVALESDGVNTEMEAFEDDDELLPEDLVLVDELEALLDWVWDTYWPCGVYVNPDERDEVPERFNSWHEAMGLNADGSLLRVVTFREFGKWFLDLHQHFVYIRRHEAATDVIILEKHEEEDGDIFSEVYQEHTTVTSVHAASFHQSDMLYASQKSSMKPRLFESQKSLVSAVTYASDMYETKSIDVDDDIDDDDIDDVHVYRGVEEDQHIAEHDDDYLRTSHKVHFDHPRSFPVVGKNTYTASQKSINASQKSGISAVTFASDYLLDVDDDDDVIDESNLESNLWGEMCETCADFDDDHIEDSIMGEPEDETEAWQRYAMSMPVDNDDRHAEECIVGDDVDNVDNVNDDSNDHDDFKAHVSEKDVYAEDCIGDASDDDIALPTKMKKGSRKVGAASIVTLPALSVGSDGIDASMTTSQQQQQQQQQQLIPVLPDQRRETDSESMKVGNVDVKAATSPLRVRTISSKVEAQPVPTTDNTIVDVVSLVIPPPPASPSLSARIEPLPMPLPLPMPVMMSHEMTPRIRISLHPETMQPMQEDTTRSLEGVTENIPPVPVVNVLSPSTSMNTATTTLSTLRVPNVEVSENEDDENLVDISELYNLLGGTGYDNPLTEEDNLPRFSEKFEYDEDEDEDEKEEEVTRGR